MKRLAASALSLFVCLTALSARAAPHMDGAPLPAQVVHAVRDAQRGGPDPVSEALDRHLRESLELTDREERSAAQINSKGAKTVEVQNALASRRAEAAAKRQEMLTLRDEVLSRLDGETKVLKTQGRSGEAAQALSFRQKLASRFDAVSQDLDDLSKADRTNLNARAKRAAARIKGWLAAARSSTSLPSPNWRRAEPVPAMTLPPAQAVPRFVADAYWLMQQKVASRDGFVRVALQNTPPEASACGYVQADKDPTAEAPSTNPEIVALAKRLDYNPVRMFEWVNQNIKFEPYYGSMKGGLGTLWSKSGGATDQASLLAALFRASNIPVRYVRGNIAVLDSTPLAASGRGPRWVGAKSYQAAATVLASNGNPAAGYGSNYVSQAHVWIEACLPYAAYRGTGLDNSGHRWVPLDPSYKDQHYQAGIDVGSTFDFNYGSWLASRLDAQGNYTLPQEALESQVEAVAKTKAPNFANTTLEDVPYKSEINRQHFDILPIVPPYEVLQYTSWDGTVGGPAETAALPDRHKYRLLVAVKTSASSLLAQKTLNLVELASKRLTLSFKGATQTDQTAFDNWFNAVDPAAAPTCATSVNMVPSIKLEGVEQTSEAGSGTTLLCSTNNKLALTVSLAELGANATRTSVNYVNIRAANLEALHAYAWHTSDTYLAKRSSILLANVQANSSNPNADRDGIEGEFLNIAASKYSRYVADASKRAGELFGESGTVGVSLGLTSAQLKVNYLFDLPYGLFRKGFLIDWPGGVYTGTRLDTPAAADLRAFKLAGFATSAYEAYIWNELTNLDAVSTTRGLQFANEQAIEILQINNSTDWANQKCKLTNTCSNGALNTNPTSPVNTNYAVGDVASIETQYVNAGYKLTIPRRLLQYPNSSGALGYAFYGENFGAARPAASFPIGGFSGGMTIEPASSSSSPSAGTGSSDTASGGFTGNNTPLSGLYNAGTGTGIIADPNATSFAQLAGLNGYQTALGWSTGTSASADPVNMVTGNLIHSERDISIKGRGGMPIVFERWYNSKSAKDSPLGFGWTHSLNHFIRFYGLDGGSSAKVSWTDGTGGERFFSTPNQSSGNISVGATFSGSPGVYATLTRLADGTYRLTERSGMVYVFENVNATATDTQQKARLVSITDRNGNALTLSYVPITGCTGTYVCKVTDSLSRSLTFSYNGSRISQITDFTNRTWQYFYDGNGDLITFKNPLAVAGSQNPVAYQYYSSLDGAKLAHAMKQYTLPRSNGMHFEYYANGRVFRHTPFGTDGVLKTDQATTFAWTEFRREAKQIDALGNERRFLFDANGNPLSITDEAGAETAYRYFTAAGQTHLRQSKTDPQGMLTGYAYDSFGNLSDVTLPSGRTLQYRDINQYGQPQRVKDANDNWTLNRYDGAGNLTDVIRVKSGIVPAVNTKPANTDILAWAQYQSDSVGNRLKSRKLRDWTTAVLGDPASGTGPSVETAYDANKLNVTSLTRRGDLDGTPASLETDVYTDFTYDSLGRTTRGPDANWYAADTAFDSLDRAVKTPDGRGHQWDTVFDANGNPLAVGLTVNGTYLDGYYAAWDDLDRLERKVDYAGNATLTQYNALGQVSQITEADGYSIGFDRDPMGRVTGAYNQEGHRVSMSLDADGRMRTSTDPNNLTTQYDYYHASEDGRLKRTTLPTVTGQTQGRAVEVAQYDGAGRPLKLNAIAADGTIRDSYRFYDELGRLTRSVGPQVSATDTSRPVTCYVYSVLGDTREIWAGSTTDTASKTCVLDGVNVKKQLARTFDDFGRKLTETDALGNVWKWNWNLHNQLTSSQTPTQIAAGQSTVYAYGSNINPGETQGLLKSRSVPGTNGQAAVYTRDALGLVTHAETRNGSNQLVVAYDYDYDPAKRLRSVTDSRPGMSVAKQLTYTWTPGGRLAMVGDSDGHMASMSYDPVGRLASVTAPNGETIGFTYDAGGRLVETRLTSGQRTTQSWFEDGNLKQKQNLYNSTVLTSHLYSLDNQGRRNGQAETIAGVAKTWSYLYNNLDRLTLASDGTAETYTYDTYGNRRSKTKAGVTAAYLYDAAQQLTEIHSGSDAGPLVGAAVHDADGHMTKLCEVSTGGTVTNPAGDCTASGTGSTTLALVWNALDQLNTATRTGAGAIAESYVYDDSGRRISKTSGATTTSYLYDGDDIHAEWNGGISGMPAAAYVQGPGIDNPLLRLTGTTNSPAATEAAYLQDGLGSVVGLANTFGTLTANQKFDAWGNKTASSGTTPTYGYTGREPDATGLVYYRARYYHPGLGRFASRDPMGMADSVSPYVYVANNPVNLIDPNGLLAQLAGTTKNPAYWGMVADNSSLSSALTDTGRALWNSALGAVEGGANLIGGGAIPGAIDYVPFLDPLRAKYDTPAFGTTVEVLTGVGAYKLLGEIGAASKATENVPTVTFSSSRAPGIKQNFDNAVANGAPTQLNRVDAATRDANRRAALRGQAPAPAGQSLDEYPFACSAQGGCGSFVSPVPVSEQSYQGGVLSRFFQNYNVKPGDSFNVKFGP